MSNVLGTNCNNNKIEISPTEFENLLSSQPWQMINVLGTNSNNSKNEISPTDFEKTW